MAVNHIVCAGASDPGRVRKNNEDRYHYDVERGIYLVVDGVGGQAAGEKAADVAVELIRKRLERKTGTPEERIREAIAVANNEILRLAKTNSEWDGMACVLTVAVVEDGAATVGHVGDSRLYLIRGDHIEKITHDHSPVGEREDRKEIGEAEAMRHPRRNEVFRDVGSEAHAPGDEGFIEILRTPWPNGSALLLCSDGLSDLVPSATILAIVRKHLEDPQEAVARLIAAANAAGGKDNVTVVLAVNGEVSRSRRSPYLWAVGAVLVTLLLCAGAAWWRWPQPVEIKPKTITVAAGGSIAAALEQARSGDSIVLEPGEYRESPRLKDGVTLRARVPRQAVVRGAITGERLQSGRLTGLHVIAAGPQALLLTGCVLDVDDNEFEGASVEFAGSSGGRFSGNYVHDVAGPGLRIGSAAQPRVSQNLFVNTKPAMELPPGAHPLITGNTVIGAEPASEGNYAIRPPRGGRK